MSKGNNKAPALMSLGENAPLFSVATMEGATVDANQGGGRTTFGDNPLNSGDAERTSTSAVPCSLSLSPPIIPVECSSSPSKAAYLAANAIGITGRKVSISPRANANGATPQSQISAVNDAVRQYFRQKKISVERVTVQITPSLTPGKYDVHIDVYTKHDCVEKLDPFARFKLVASSIKNVNIISIDKVTGRLLTDEIVVRQQDKNEEVAKAIVKEKKHNKAHMPVGALSKQPSFSPSPTAAFGHTTDDNLPTPAKLSLEYDENNAVTNNIIPALNQMVDHGNNLQDLTFVMTGTFPYEDEGRNSYKGVNAGKPTVERFIEDNGGEVVDVVSKKVDFLVRGERPGRTKVDQAKAYNIRIIGLSDLYNFSTGEVNAKQLRERGDVTVNEYSEMSRRFNYSAATNTTAAKKKRPRSSKKDKSSTTTTTTTATTATRKKRKNGKKEGQSKRCK